MCLVSGALALVSGDCVVMAPRLFSRKSSLGAESWSCCIRHSLHVMSSVGRAQPGCP